MTNQLRVALEIGPMGKKVVAVASDWPGLERGAKTGEEAVEKLRAYWPRYAPVARLAGMDAAFDAIQNVDVVEEYPGTGSTDFWGISFAPSSIDRQPMSAGELERELVLLQACWAFFDQVRGRVSAEMRKGPRGGGRDRDRIVRHTFAAEQDWAKGIGVLTPDGAMLTDEGLKAHRHAYCQAIREYHSRGKPAGRMAKSPLRFLIRHTAFHTLDHAWEMEDKDLTTDHRPPTTMLTLLFLCTGNSARSILAEALANHLGTGRLRAYSAGSRPKDAPHPLALELLTAQGIDTAGLRSKSWNEFAGPDAPAVDVVITVCDNAAGEVCPIWPGRPTRVHWGIPDPAAEAGSEDQRRAAFARAYATLGQRIAAALALPLERMTAEEVQTALAELAREA